MKDLLPELLLELEQFGLSNDSEIIDRPRRMLNITRGGCKKFCVNGHLAGNCHNFERSEYDRSKESPIPRFN